MRLSRNLSFALGACLALAVLAPARAEDSRNGLVVTSPNGYANLSAQDLELRSTAGPVRWTRSWNGQEWKFNPQWESLSQSWSNLTGSQTQDSSGSLASGNSDGSGVVLDTPAPRSAGLVSMSGGGGGEGCWVWVDEDWQPTYSAVIEVSTGLRDAGPLIPLRSTPFNRTMPEAGSDYSPGMRVSVDYASLCAGSSSASGAVSMEGIRRINELHLGDNGRYSFNNRTVLEKRTVRQQAPATAAALASGQVAPALVSNDKGYRWIDRSGAWIDYNTQGQVVAYGDRNDNAVWLVRDAGGTLRGVVDAAGRVLLTLHYTGALVTEVRDYPVAGLAQDLPPRSVKYAYDERNRLTQVTDVRGNLVKYEYDIGNHIVKITDQEGHAETLLYAGETVKKRTAPDGGVTDYEFDYDDANKQFVSKITGPETPAGRRVEDITQNRVGKLVRRLYNGQVDAEMRYDTGARAETVTNARGFTTRTTRNEFDQPVELVNPDGTTRKYSYSAANLAVTESVDEAGIKSAYLRDARGNLLKLTQAVGTPQETVIEYERNSLGQAIRTTRKGRTEANGTVTLDAVWLSEFDARGQLQKITDAEGHEHRYVFDRAGNTVGYTDPRGNATAYEVDADGNLVKITDALARVVTLSYDKLGSALSQADGRGKVVRAAYDAMGRVTQYTNPVGGAYRLQYDAQGQAIRETDEDGRTSLSEFDNLLRLTKHVDPLGNATQYGYQVPDGSQAGQRGSLRGPTEITYPTFTQRLRYDAGERTTSETLLNPTSHGVEGLVSSTAYEARGLVKSDTDANGKTSSSEYDALGRLTAAIDSLGNKTQALYDVRGNLLQITDAKGHASKFEYDRNNQVVKEILPLGQVTQLAYDEVGNLTGRTDANGNQATYGYDAVNRLVDVKQYRSGNVLVRSTHYTWDDSDNLKAWTDTDLSRPEGQQSTAATSTYDDASRLTGETVSYPMPDGGTTTLSYGYAYSAAGRKTQLTWPDGSVIGYGYSGHAELETVTIPGEGSISVNEFKWLAPAKVTLPGGGTQERTLDGLLQMEGLKVKTPGQQTVLSVANTFGKVQELKTSNRTDTANNVSTSRNSSLAYDDEVRLTQATVDAGASGTETETFTLDAVGNRVAHSRVSGAWTYDDNNRLLQRGSGAAATSYEYDEAGNLTKMTEPGGKVTQYGYDTQNRLVVVKDGAGQLVARYGYDPLDRRLWREQYRHQDGTALVPATRSYYLYADEGLIAESRHDIVLNADGSVASGGTPAIATQYGPRPDAEFSTGMLFAKAADSNGGTTVAYLHADQLGTPIQATDRAGNVVWAASYNVFGKATITTPAATPERPIVALSLRLPGQVEDPETGLHYNYRRYYDASTGRYITQDPIGLAGGDNRYRYVEANPVNLFDPTGEILPAAVVAAAEMIAACTAECSLLDTAEKVVTGECNDVGQTVKDCARDCALTLGIGWAAKKVWKYGKKLWDRIPCAIQSFPQETLVHVKPRGASPQDAWAAKAELKPIGELQVGDEVLAFSEWKNKGLSPRADERLGYEKVTDIFSSHKEQLLVHLGLDNGETLTATEGHAFRTTQGWRDAALIERGSQLVGKGTGDAGPVRTVVDVRTERKVLTVLNLEVANAHTYFSGADGLLVHNHGNSKSCSKFQYLYEIFNKKTGTTRKYGVTGTPPRANGTLPRPNSQLGPGEDYRIVDTAGNRTDILQKEKDAVDAYKAANGSKPVGNKRP
jgi:RHS repeat-associated protein